MCLRNEGVVVTHENRAAVSVSSRVGRAAVEAVGVEHHSLTRLRKDPNLFRKLWRWTAISAGTWRAEGRAVALRQDQRIVKIRGQNALSQQPELLGCTAAIAPQRKTMAK